MDFITNLPPDAGWPLSGSGTDYLYNTILTVTCRFSKAKILIPGHKDWKTADWATAFSNQVIPYWGLPKVSIRLANSPVQSQTVGFLGTVFETGPYGLVSKRFGLKGFFIDQTVRFGPIHMNKWGPFLRPDRTVFAKNGPVWDWTVWSHWTEPRNTGPFH